MDGSILIHLLRENKPVSEKNVGRVSPAPEELRQGIEEPFQHEHELYAALDLLVRFETALEHGQKDVGAGAAGEGVEGRAVGGLAAVRGAALADRQRIGEEISQQPQDETRPGALRRRLLAGRLR